MSTEPPPFQATPSRRNQAAINARGIELCRRLLAERKPSRDQPQESTEKGRS